MPEVTVHHGDSRDVLKSIPDASIDSCVCDPPYALVSITKRFGKDGAAPAKAGKTGAYARASAGFMGQKWDTGETAFDPAFWAEVWRVLKPGAHVIAFSGTRTYHRLACAIEDAGFEIRDMVAWLYGSGFPKSHDVSKGIDKAAGAEREITGHEPDRWTGKGSVLNFATDRAQSEIPVRGGPATDAARQWEGWGTALKPALEPVVLARKPLIGTVAENVLQHGTGALNIDGCRVEGEAQPYGNPTAAAGYNLHKRAESWKPSVQGRWPANVIHDGSAEVIEAFPEAPGQQRAVTGAERSHRTVNAYGDFGPTRDGFEPRGDSGSAARFFYTAKANKFDRFGTSHPTVKPVNLMRWLCRLVTPARGVILDPFAGSGTTGAAAYIEGFDCILIEREEKYVADIHRRMKWLRGEGRLLVQEIETRPPAHSEGPFFSEFEGAA